MSWFVSYVGANWSLAVVVTLSVGGMALIAFLTRNLWAVVIALGLMAAGFAYVQVDKAAYQRRVSEEAAQQVKALQGRLDTLQAVNAADVARSLADAERIANLELQAMQTPANDAPCLPEDAAKRVGDIR
jgi:uncharacterized protein HemX